MKTYLWQHLQVGDNVGHFTILKHFISAIFKFWNALETGAVKVTAECVNEDEDSTSYLVTCEGTGVEPGKWCGEFTVNNDNNVAIWGGDDLHDVTPESARHIILFQMLYGFEE